MKYIVCAPDVVIVASVVHVDASSTWIYTITVFVELIVPAVVNVNLVHAFVASGNRASQYCDTINGTVAFAEVDGPERTGDTSLEASS